ncbi:MAG: hypothetical protein ABFS56_18265, partial [Pseudomonadota bacterium]
MLIELAILGGGAALWRKLKRKKTTSFSSVVQQTTEKENQQAPFDGKKLVYDLKNAIWGDERQQLQLSLDPNMQADIERRKKEKNRNFVLSSGALGLTLLGTVSPAFHLLGSAAVLYLARHIFHNVLQDFKQKRFITVYLSSAVLLIGMIAVGQLILAAIAGLMGSFMVKLIKKAEDNSQKHLIKIFSGHTDKVWLEKDGVEIQVPFETVPKNDIIIVHAGEIIPVDGVIQTGSASIDQHILTGESQPVERTVGDTVFAATLMLTGNAIKLSPQKKTCQVSKT